MKRWSVVPRTSSFGMPRAVPMTASASAAQVAAMQAGLAHSVSQADAKAQKAYTKAQTAYSLAETAQTVSLATLLKNQGMMLSILAALIIAVLFFMK